MLHTSDIEGMDDVVVILYLTMKLYPFPFHKRLLFSMNSSLNLSLKEMPGSLLPDPGDLMIGFKEESIIANDTETQDTRFTSTNNLRIVSLAGKKCFKSCTFCIR